MNNSNEKIIKIVNINTYMCADNEVILCGEAYSSNWEAENVQIRIDAHEVLEWVNMKDIKEKYIEYINKIVD